MNELDFFFFLAQLYSKCMFILTRQCWIVFQGDYIPFSLFLSIIGSSWKGFLIFLFFSLIYLTSECFSFWKMPSLSIQYFFFLLLKHVFGFQELLTNSVNILLWYPVLISSVLCVLLTLIILIVFLSVLPVKSQFSLSSFKMCLLVLVSVLHVSIFSPMTGNFTCLLKFKGVDFKACSKLPVHE